MSLASLILPYSFSLSSVLKPSGNSVDRSCLHRTPGILISRAREDVLQSGAANTTLEMPACLHPSAAEPSTKMSYSFLPLMVRPLLRSQGGPAGAIAEMATGGPGTLEAKMWGTLHGPGTLAATIWGTLNFSGSLPCKRAFVLSASTARLARPRRPWRSATVWTSFVKRRVARARARSSGCGWTPTRPPDGRHLSGGLRRLPLV